MRPHPKIEQDDRVLDACKRATSVGVIRRAAGCGWLTRTEAAGAAGRACGTGVVLVCPTADWLTASREAPATIAVKRNDLMAAPSGLDGTIHGRRSSISHLVRYGHPVVTPCRRPRGYGAVRLLENPSISWRKFDRLIRYTRSLRKSPDESVRALRQYTAAQEPSAPGLHDRWRADRESVVDADLGGMDARNILAPLEILETACGREAGA